MQWNYFILVQNIVLGLNLEMILVSPLLVNEVSVSLFHTYGPGQPNSELPMPVHLGYNLSVSWQTCQKLSLASSSGLWVGQLALKNIKREWGHIASPLVPRHSAPGTDQMAFLQFPNLEFPILQSHLHIPVRRKRKRQYTELASKMIRKYYSCWSN